MGVGPGGYIPWRSDTRGHWVSTVFGLGFEAVRGTEASELRIWDRQGRPLPTLSELRRGDR
jgi:hypothetical protein